MPYDDKKQYSSSEFINTRPDLKDVMKDHMRTVTEPGMNNASDKEPGRGELPGMPPGHKAMPERMNAGKSFNERRPKGEGLKRGDAV